MKLDDVTLVAISGKEEYAESHKKVLKHCLNLVDFKDVILCCPKKDNEFKTVQTHIMDLSLYNKFCVEELYKYIKTEYCLLIQPDGFIINANMWTDEFLEYDYIGAPWPCSGNMIGNGGFSLRSKKFLNACAELKYTSNAHILAGLSPKEFKSGVITAEDWFICNHNAAHLKNRGIKLPEAKLAFQFSVEHPDNFQRVKLFNREDINSYQSFGFHGAFNTAGMRELK